MAEFTVIYFCLGFLQMIVQEFWIMNRMVIALSGCIFLFVHIFCYNLKCEQNLTSAMNKKAIIKCLISLCVLVC